VPNTPDPGLNGLTASRHPTQAMTDYFTAWEHLGDLKRPQLAYVGDGSNMAHSLMFGARKSHAQSPWPRREATRRSIRRRHPRRRTRIMPRTKVIVTTSIERPSAGCDVARTDVWASMGQEGGGAEEAADFEGWQGRVRVSSFGQKEAIFIALPSRRIAVKRSPARSSTHRGSVITDEAKNRCTCRKRSCTVDEAMTRAHA